jgi:hypothetical protein
MVLLLTQVPQETSQHLTLVAHVALLEYLQLIHLPSVVDKMRSPTA